MGSINSALNGIYNAIDAIDVGEPQDKTPTLNVRDNVKKTSINIKIKLRYTAYLRSSAREFCSVIMKYCNVRKEIYPDDQKNDIKM